jgi:catechol 2,3-dioxygenase-like lactoylglutathione lyase family enzyme
MKRYFMLAVAAWLAIGFARAQPTDSSAPSAEALVVGSGNYFSPIVRDLDAAIAFYRDGLGLQVQGAPADASANPALRDMFGLPDARIRWVIARTPGIAGGLDDVVHGEANAHADDVPLGRVARQLRWLRELDEVAVRVAHDDDARARADRHGLPADGDHRCAERA